MPFHTYTGVAPKPQINQRYAPAVNVSSLLAPSAGWCWGILGLGCGERSCVYIFFGGGPVHKEQHYGWEAGPTACARHIWVVVLIVQQCRVSMRLLLVAA